MTCGGALGTNNAFAMHGGKSWAPLTRDGPVWRTIKPPLFGKQNEPSETSLMARRCTDGVSKKKTSATGIEKLTGTVFALTSN